MLFSGVQHIDSTILYITNALYSKHNHHLSSHSIIMIIYYFFQEREREREYKQGGNRGEVERES